MLIGFLWRSWRRNCIDRPAQRAVAVGKQKWHENQTLDSGPFQHPRKMGWGNDSTLSDRHKPEQAVVSPKLGDISLPFAVVSGTARAHQSNGMALMAGRQAGCYMRKDKTLKFANSIPPGAVGLALHAACPLGIQNVPDAVSVKYRETIYSKGTTRRG